ncbi:restriction endonuclease [Alicyclobacillus hesperidum subsp. aegles]|uniref:restriction endonuclease subunit S n=1 Tax=Alicyclobacillus hesperidum TaxID=89784 RepID=UPI00222953B1|nr:restriction endonuclease subunit S [Alicyclobacillus hesperidum]GLG01210.1 restriction endonuclease [Alicyclobacillus hesperidum subsp. aegles]
MVLMERANSSFNDAKMLSGWKTLSLEDICVDKGLIRGPFGGALKKESFVPTGYKVYEQKNAIYQDAQLGDYFINGEKYEELKRFAVGAGDFIVSCSGTIGRIFRIPEGSPMGVINQALLLIKIDHRKINSDYFYQYFQWDGFQRRIIDSTQGGAMPNLVGMGLFKKTTLAVPPLDEQQRIAKVLATWDKAIELKQRLIEQKRLRKTGLMQHLLSGKVRWNDGSKFSKEEIKARIDMIDDGMVPEGYHQTEVGIVPIEWSVKRLDELFTFEGGYPATRADLFQGEDGICYLHYGDIHTSVTDFVDVEAQFNTIPKIYVPIENVVQKYLLQHGDIVFADASEDYDGIGKSLVVFNKTSIPFIAGLHTIIARDKTRLLDNVFKRFFLSNHAVRKQMMFYASGISVYGLSKRNIGNILVALPERSEQKRIAVILASCDKEIRLLEQELEALRRQKTGLTQLLFTGNVRV